VNDVDSIADQSRFFLAVIRALRDSITMWTQKEERLEAYGNFHWPLVSCYHGGCVRRGVTLTGLFTRGCNWEDTRKLAVTFFQTGPDTSDDWRRLARATGFDADDLHDLLLGVFLGGGPAPRSSRDVVDTLNQIAARVEAGKTVSFPKGTP